MSRLINESNASNFLNIDKFESFKKLYNESDSDNSLIHNFIYLDFDGVITTTNTRFKIDESRVKLLLDFIKETPNTYIIISSSWRYNTLDETISNFESDRFSRINSKLFEELITYIVGVTPRTNMIRGEEINLINMYIKYKLKIKTFNYIILDDDIDMIISQQKYFIKTHAYFGLCENDIDKIKHIINISNDKRRLLSGENIRATTFKFVSNNSTDIHTRLNSKEGYSEYVLIPIYNKNGNIKEHNTLSKIFETLEILIRNNPKTLYHFNFDSYMETILKKYDSLSVLEKVKYESIIQYFNKINSLNLLIK